MPHDNVYTKQDCALLRELTGPHMAVLLSRKKDQDSRHMKKLVWEEVTTKYNEREHSAKRTPVNLKRKWDDLLQKEQKRMRQITDDVGDLNPQIREPRVAKVEKPVTRSSTSQSAQSKPATPIVSNRHAVDISADQEISTDISADQEISVIENETKGLDNKDKALMRKLLLTQIRYHRRQIEIMEAEHQLKKEILEIKKKKLTSDSNADSNRCLQISITK